MRNQRLAIFKTWQWEIFLSVYLDDALKRIGSILGDEIETPAAENFKALGEHRNQIVHFAHSGMDDLGATQAGVIVEAWASWHYLYGLLTGPWKAVFEPYSAELHVLNQRIMRQGEFIKARFEILQPQIEIQKERQRDYGLRSLQNDCGNRRGEPSMGH
ncbi:hypothetical protein ACFQDJ_00790 [Pseudomonas brassicacearum]